MLNKLSTAAVTFGLLKNVLSFPNRDLVIRTMGSVTSLFTPNIDHIFMVVPLLLKVVEHDH